MHTAILDLSSLRVLVFINHVLVDTFIHDFMNITVYPRLAKRS